MSRLPILTFRKLSKILKKLGYLPVRQKGSHVIFKKDKNNMLCIPHHKGRTLPKGLLRKYISELDLTVEEFLELC